MMSLTVPPQGEGKTIRRSLGCAVPFGRNTPGPTDALLWGSSSSPRSSCCAPAGAGVAAARAGGIDLLLRLPNELVHIIGRVSVRGVVGGAPLIGVAGSLSRQLGAASGGCGGWGGPACNQWMEAGTKTEQHGALAGTSLSAPRRHSEASLVSPASIGQECLSVHASCPHSPGIYTAKPDFADSHVTACVPG